MFLQILDNFRDMDIILWILGTIIVAILVLGGFAMVIDYQHFVAVYNAPIGSQELQIACTKDNWYRVSCG